ncbi:MAG: SMC family ATPase [Candidatus Micrarchaeota archaeon]|nr:SMC family ATPase [Candidatus Micrarchaeota archaeon]MDE1847721.1 SMC family ATPase [Candidatus Micrarchaeota archaeon]MDE1864150.1 SMC family ATPase [Candidatus Micrarchaeota archaeon]
MINSIELHNWKTHKDTRLVFNKGTNVLVGLMGAGKSSIMDAISYALFGTFPAIQHRRLGINDIITSRPNQENEASVKLSFAFDGNNYTVERGISTGEGAKATLQKNGSYLQSQPQRVSEEIERILKVDYDLFSRAIYSEQNRLDYFLELRASERKSQIDELLGLDKFAKAQENATSLINRIKDTIVEHQKLVQNFDGERLSKELKSLELELENLKTKKFLLEKEHKETEVEARESETKLKSMKELLAKKTSLIKECAEIKSKSDFIDAEIDKLNKLGLPSRPELEKIMAEVTRQFSDAMAREQQAMENERKAAKELSDAEAALSVVKQRIVERDKLQSQYKDYNLESEEKKLAYASDLLHQLEKGLAAYQSQKEETKKWIAELEKHISKCPACERELDTQMKEKLIDAKKAAVGSAETGIKSSEVQIKAKKTEIENLRKSLDGLRLAHSKLKDYVGLDELLAVSDGKIKNSKGAYEKFKQESELVKKEYELLHNRLSELNSNKEKSERLEGHSRQLKELRLRHEKKSGESEAIQVDEKTLEGIQKSFVEISSRSSKLESEIEAHVRYLADKQKLIDEKNDQLSRIEKILGEISEKKAAIDNLSKFKNALEETQRAMRTRLVGSINDVMQGIWPEIYPYDDYTGIMLEADSDDYVLKVRTATGAKEKWEEVQGIASGGERSIGCLAMRVAFALVLVPNLRWMILDEPTHNIDEQGMARFVRVFNEKLPQIIDQIFIITHDEQLKQASSSKTYILTRNKGENGATTIQEQ